MARFFIDRPIFAWVLSIVVLLVGGVCIFFLPVDLYPNITPPTVQVSAVYQGANAEVVASTVGIPIEQQVNGVENMLYMSSQSTNDGSYSLTVTFEVGTDMNMAQVLVQNRVQLATPLLPTEVQIQGVTVRKRSPNILFTINLISPDHRYDSLYLSNYATVNLLDEMLRIKGVGDVSILGQRSFSMRVWVDPDKLATRNLTAVDVVNAIKSQNVQVAAGAVGQEPVPPGQRLQLTMTTLGRLQTVKQFGDIVIKAGSGNPNSGASPAAASPSPGSPTATLPSTPIVYLRDVAQIELGAQNYDVDSRLDGEPSAGLAIFQLPGSNALDVTNRVKSRIQELSKTFPPGLQYTIVYDTTPFIRQSIDEVFKALLEAVLVVALVVLFFLQDWKAMILPMIDVPVSLVGTFAVMAALGFSLNNLTLFGLVLAVGIVVDDAIMVLENIERLIGTGLNARDATIQAMRELTGPILAITLVLSSVFVPTIFVPGLTGQFYRQFAVTIAASMIISAMNAMTLTPSRAVSIFRTEEVGAASRAAPGGPARLAGPTNEKEALPWWIFGVLGAYLTWWLAQKYLATTLGLSEEAGPPAWRFYLIQAGTCVPGALVGGAIGWFIIHPVNAGLGWIFRQFNHFFDWITDRYGWLVGKFLRLSVFVLLVYGGLLFLTFWTFHKAPTGFLPTQDQGYLLVSVQLPDAASVQRTQEVMHKIDRIARGDPNDRTHYPGIPGVAHTVGIAGTSFLLGTNSSNLGSMFVVLKPWAQRENHEEYDATIAEKIQAQCAREVEGAIVGVFRAPPIRGIGNAGGFQLQTEQHGFVDLKELQAATDQLVQKINADPHFAGSFTQFRASAPQLFVDVNRTKAQALQVPMQDVFTTMQVYMGGQFVNQFNRFGRTWEVQIQAAPRFRVTADILKRAQVRNSQG
ncbi:MAG: efflux RND transporter permease subunit, partial [Planctomycetes bacterium]|nr:efflux RND transporter permease subunit [Planctomycetota bacterium]